jgi:Trk K+ transport system NAD-binding subunit
VGATFLLFTMATLGFLLSQLNESVLEVRRMEDEGLIGTRFDEHVVVVGFGAVASAAIVELITAGRKVALLCERNDELEFARRLGDSSVLYTTCGEPTQKNLVERLNAEAARTAVVASHDDATNIVAALNLRAVNKHMRIVVAVKNEALRQTLIASGVTYVASPYEFSGRLVASAAFEPEVAHFIEDISTGTAGSDVQQFPAGPFASKTVGAVRDELEALDGPLLVALSRRDGDAIELLSNPRKTTVVRPVDQLIVLGSVDQLERLAKHLGARQGV